MKINSDFILREFADEYIIVPTGESAVKFNGMMNLTETGAVIWKGVLANKTRDEIVVDILNEFNIDEEIAKKDVNGFIDELILVGIIEE